MFGYVKPHVDSLTVAEYEQYKGVYCSLCKALGKHFGPLSRLTLSFDFTFLAILGLAMGDDCAGFKNFRCKLNPAKKRLIASENDISKNVSFIAVIMIYYKLCDDVEDTKSAKKLVKKTLRAFARAPHKKAAGDFEKIESAVKKVMEEQKEAENGEPSLDRLADPSSKALGMVFETMGDKTGRLALQRLGYMLGRWIYIIDAIDDFEKDEKQKAFNAVKACYNNLSENTLDELKCILNQTAAEIFESFKQLKLKRFEGILENIVTKGLCFEEQRILKKIRGATE